MKEIFFTIYWYKDGTSSNCGSLDLFSFNRFEDAVDIVEILPKDNWFYIQCENRIDWPIWRSAADPLWDFEGMCRQQIVNHLTRLVNKTIW